MGRREGWEDRASLIPSLQMARLPRIRSDQEEEEEGGGADTDGDTSNSSLGWSLKKGSTERPLFKAFFDVANLIVVSSCSHYSLQRHS